LMFAPREAYSKEKIKNIYECMWTCSLQWIKLLH
jgi:hypothetical protein